MAVLCLMNEEGEVVTRWHLSEQAVAVGRGSSVDVKIDDAGLSRRHFMIVREEDDYFLKDLSSRNGTFVNGTRILVSKLNHNHAILAGNTQFRFFEQVAGTGMAFLPLTGPHDTVVITATVAA